MGNLEKMDILCEMLLDWNILLENDEGQFFPTMSPCIIWPEAVAYQNSFEGDFKRIMQNRACITTVFCCFKGDKPDRLRGVGLANTRKLSGIWRMKAC